MASTDKAVIRSFILAPANRPDLVRKFPRFGADCYVIDLEDGTPEDAKTRARSELRELVREVRSLGLDTLLFIRVNEPASAHTPADLAAVAECDVDGVVIPKLESPDQLAGPLAALKKGAGRAQVVIGGIETTRGVLNAVDIAASRQGLLALYFGSEDFATEMGARRTAAGMEILYARSRVVLAARAAGVIAIDQGIPEIRDDNLFTSDANAGRDLGYHGKVCLLPRQVEIANEIFSPTAAEIEHSSRLIAAYESALAQGRGTIDFAGQMVDGPLLKRARAVLNAAALLQAPR